MARSVSKWRTWMTTELDGVLALSDTELARRPDLIPWMFPTGSSCGHAVGAPIIGQRELRELGTAEPVLQTAQRRAFDRVMQMLGLEQTNGELRWRAGSQPWAQTPRRDWRVYRLLRSVHDMGLRTESSMLMRFLESELGGDPQRARALLWFRHQVETA